MRIHTSHVVIVAFIGISVLIVGYFTSFANAATCEPQLTIEGASTSGEIAQGKNVTLKISVLNQKDATITGYTLKMPSGINELNFTPSSMSFTISANTLRIFDFNVTVNTASGDYQLVFILFNGGDICNFAVYHFIVARESFTPGIYNVTAYNEILNNIIDEDDILNDNVVLNLSRIDHVLKIIAAGVLVSVGIWGIFNANPIWIVEDRKRHLNHQFKRGLALVSAAVAEILFSSYLFAKIKPSLLIDVPYGNEIYGLLCTGTTLFTILGFDQQKYRITAIMFLLATLLTSSLVLALGVLIVIGTTTCLYFLQRAARLSGAKTPPAPKFVKISKREKKIIYEL